MGFFDSFKTGLGGALGQIGAGLIGSLGQAAIGAVFGGGGGTSAFKGPIPSITGPGGVPIFNAPIAPVGTGGFAGGLTSAQIQQLQLLEVLKQGQLQGSPASAPSAIFNVPQLGAGSIGTVAGSPGGGFQNVAFPTNLSMGFPATTASFGSTLQQLGQFTGLGLPGVDVVGQGLGGVASALGSPFRPTMAGARAQPFVAANPVTGAVTWFKPAGRPILWSGDLTACRRVNKIARRARRAKR